uniref:hypothetical protein n=1 Tax=Nocardia farcinica TaxID=37329 RepID=UPI003CC7C5C4
MAQLTRPVPGVPTDPVLRTRTRTDLPAADPAATEVELGGAWEPATVGATAAPHLAKIHTPQVV